MKKSLISVIAGAIISIIGAGLFTSTYLNGATGFHSEYVNIGVDESGDFGFYVGKRSSTVAAVPVREDPAVVSAPIVDYGTNGENSTWDNGSVTGMSITQHFSELYLDVSCAEVKICVGRDVSEFGKVEWKNLQEVYCENDGESLSITVADEARSSDSKKLTITLPAGFSIYSISGNVNLGSVEIKDVDVSNIDLDLDLGEISLQEIPAADWMDLYRALGDIELKDVNCATLYATADLGDIDVEGTIGEANLTLSMGSADFEGSIGDFTIQNDMGDVEMEINGPQTDYDLDIENNLGEIQVMGQKTSSSYVSGSPDAPYRGTIWCSTGKVEVQFRK